MQLSADAGQASEGFTKFSFEMFSHSFSKALRVLSQGWILSNISSQGQGHSSANALLKLSNLETPFRSLVNINAQIFGQAVDDAVFKFRQLREYAELHRVHISHVSRCGQGCSRIKNHIDSMLYHFIGSQALAYRGKISPTITTMFNRDFFRKTYAFP